MARIRRLISIASVLASLATFARAESQSFMVPLFGGQGLSGSVNLHVDWKAGPDLVVTIDQMTLNYVPHAAFNNFDDKYQALQVAGLLLVPQSGGKSTGAETRVLVPLEHVQIAKGSVTCAPCGSGIVPQANMAESDRVIPALVVNDVILFLQEADLTSGRPSVTGPDAQGASGAADGSAALADIARAANMPVAGFPNLLNLQAADYSLLASAAASIKDATGMDDLTKATLLSAVMQAANMAYSPILQKFVLDKFALDSRIVFQGVLANPVGYAHDAVNGASTDFLKGAAIDIAGAMAADALFSLKPLADMTPEWKAPLHAMMKATVVELINLAKSSGEPTEAVQGIAARIYDFYEIYKASVGLADDQNEAVVQTAVSLETAARLVTLNPSAKANEIARSTIADAVANLKQVYGDSYSVAITDIVNLTFVGLLSDLRGDRERALTMVAHIREAGKLGANDGLPNVLAHPLNWVASVASWSGDPTSRTAALMISTTVLGRLEADKGPKAAEVPVQPLASTTAERWGPDIVAAQGLTVEMQQCRKESARRCLADQGLSGPAIDFALAAFDGSPGVGVATEFRELGAVDWVDAGVMYSPYEDTMLVNGTPDIIHPDVSRDLWAAFPDDASRAMLRKFPNASAIGGRITGFRMLPNGRQRFVFVETVFDQCHACPILGSAISFLEFDRTGRLVERRAVGLDLALPDNTEDDMTTDLLVRKPEVLQVALNIRGYDAGPMDGAPGPQSRTALMELQAEHCLPITGQPDQATVTALIDGDSFSVPCPGATLPPGISANLPLLAGMYIDDPAKCDLEQMPIDESLVSQRIINGAITFGIEETCLVNRTDIRNGVTVFRGTCSEGIEEYPGSWTFDVQSSEAFLEVQKNSTAPPRKFTKCADDSTLRVTWKAWFGQ